MNKGKLKGKLRGGFVPFLLFLTFVIPVIAGVLIGAGGMKGFEYAGTVSIIALTGIVALNLIATGILRKMKINMRKTREKMLSQKDKLLANYNKYFRSVKFIKFLGSLYITVFFLLIPLTNTYIVAKVCALKIPALAVLLFTAGIAILIYEIYFLIRLCIKPDEIFPELYIYLSPEEYPHIWEMANAEMANAGLSIKLVILAVPGNNAGVTKRRGGLYELIVGLNTLYNLSCEELSAVFKHEFMHVKNKELDYSFMLNQKFIRWMFLLQKTKFFPTFLFSPLGSAICFRLERFLFLSSYNIEVRADSAFVGGEKQSVINAIGKMQLFNINALFTLNNAFDYAADDYPADILDHQQEKFKAGYRENKERWDKFLYNQPPAKIDTHPNLSERMKLLGVPSFEVSYKQTDEALKSETAKLGLMFTNYIKSISPWSEAKEMFLTTPAAFIEGFSKGQVEYCQRLNEAAFNYYVLGDMDKSEEVCLRALEKNPDNPDALFHYAILLSYKLDDRCADYFLRCLDYYSYAHSAMERASAYFIYIADKEMLERYSDAYIDKTSRFIDFASKSPLFIRKHFLSAEQTRLLSDYVSRDTDIASAILFGKKSGGIKRSLLLFQPREGVTEERAKLIKRRLLWLISDNLPHLIVDIAFDEKYPALLGKKRFCLKKTVNKDSNYEQ